MSESLWGKLAKVLAEVPNFVTDETAQIPDKSGAIRRTYKYLNLATILKAIKPVFARNGLCFTQNVSFDYSQDGKGMQVGVVETIVFDSESHVTLGRYPFVLTGDPQANGSAVTYARRYALYSVLGIYPDKDDDGAAARDYVNRNPMTQQQLNTLNSAITSSGLSGGALLRELSRLAGHSVGGPQDIDADDYAKIMRAFDAREMTDDGR